MDCTFVSTSGSCSRRTVRKGLQRSSAPFKSARTATCTARTSGRLTCRGILDTYRAAQAEKAREAETGQVAGEGAWDAETSAADDGDDTPCEVECVKQVFTPKEFKLACQEAGSALVVVDFYRTACGACKYIQPGFQKLCKASESDHAPVVFLKHNVYDDEDEQTELAAKLSIKSVPMFQFYKDMELIEGFATRDRKRIALAINKYTGADTVHVHAGDEELSTA